MKAIIIGPSASGKSTLIKKLRAITGITPVREIDEALTTMNNGVFPADAKYKHEMLIPQIVKKVIHASGDLLFFSNTDYFTIYDIEVAKRNGFIVIGLFTKLPELQKRNGTRVTRENYPDISQYLPGMLEYMSEMSRLKAFDYTIDTDQGMDNTFIQLQKVLTEHFTSDSKSL